KPTFLMSWTRTRSSVLRRLREGRGTFSSFMSSGSAGAVEKNLHRHPRPQDGLRGIASDLHDDLERAARRVHGRADVLHDPGRSGFWKLLRNHVDPVSLVDAQEPLLGEIDPGEKRLERSDLEKRYVCNVDKHMDINGDILVAV